MIDKIPIIAPVIAPLIKRIGRYSTILNSSKMTIATAICPILCAIAPQMLIPIGENLFVFFRIIITKKLKNPPTILYQKDVKEPNSIEHKTILTVFMLNAEYALSAYSITTVTRFAIPNFIPYIPIGKGIRCSIYPKTMARAVITPHRAIERAVFLFMALTSR